MRQKLPNLAMILSLLLFVAVVMLWVRSYRYEGESISLSGGFVLGHDRGLNVASQEGRVLVAYIRWEPSGSAGEAGRLKAAHSKRDIFTPSLVQSRAGDGRVGFAAWAGRQPFFSHSPWPALCFAGIVPHWGLALAFSLVPTLWIRTRWRHMRLRVPQPQCPVCGYDLRATPDRCPECGAMPVPAA